jgi:hypothetical protein
MRYILLAILCLFFIFTAFALLAFSVMMIIEHTFITISIAGLCIIGSIGMVFVAVYIVKKALGK